ncbi:MAG TPA: heparan-alpha-glucosaminide N-acetyltransferase domain-containing protein [Burkholderiales bacterium]|nr:heparan-alpha-glucosaminide N-acetyltransferase domain-containing protein [Burkholderiales bacterium]
MNSSLEATAAIGGAISRPAPASAAHARVRLDSIDLLRGLVMIIMVLDHTRDFVGMSAMNPRDVHEPVLFLTRWITHFCAPVFILLAGVSAFLYGTRGRTTRELSAYLFTRGLWLVLLEMTLVRMGWTFNLRYDFVLLQVIWAIGASMVVLSALVHLPRRAVTGIALGLVLGHNLLDPIKAEQVGWLWHFLHHPDMLRPSDGLIVFALYPLIPWVGVMALGYALGPVFAMAPEPRRQWLLRAGVGTIIGFTLLRLTNWYGDPAPWALADGVVPTVLSFINCEKYPPSVLYLAVTLGPALVLLAYADRAQGVAARVIVTFGRVPMIFYIAHIFLLHAIAVFVAGAWFGDARWLFQGLPIISKPEDYGLTLTAVYTVWIAAVAALYPLCRWFAQLKQRRSDRWLTYL